MMDGNWGRGWFFYLSKWDWFDSSRVSSKYEADLGQSDFSLRGFYFIFPNSSMNNKYNELNNFSNMSRELNIIL